MSKVSLETQISHARGYSLFSNWKKQEEEQQLSHLFQVFGGSVGYMNQNRIMSDRFMNQNRNMSSLRLLASTSCRITSIYVFFDLPYALLTCLNMIRSTRWTDVSVGLRHT